MLGGGGLRPPRRRPVELDARVVSGRRRQPAVGLVGQLRRRRHHARRARDRRDRLHERPGDAAREGDLHRRGAAVPGRAARLRRPQGVRARGRVRLLHRRDHVHEGHDPRHVRVGDAEAEDARPTDADAARARAGSRRRPRTSDPRPSPIRGPRQPLRSTAKSTSSRASSASRRSSSTRTRTSGRASSICPSSRCTRRRTG